MRPGYVEPVRRAEQRWVARGRRGLPPPAVRRAITDAVVLTLARHFPEAGDQGACMPLALIAGAVASTLLGTPYQAQAGYALIPCDPPDGFLEYGGAAMDRGDFHCWVARAGDVRCLELWDPSCRYYDRMAAQVRFPWSRGTPPELLWGTARQVAPWLRVRAVDASTRRMLQLRSERDAFYAPLIDEAVERGARALGAASAGQSR